MRPTKLTAGPVLHCSLLLCSARLLADEVRSATVSYLSVVKGAEGGVTKLSVPRFHLHPALQRAYKAAEAAWRQVRRATCSCTQHLQLSWWCDEWGVALFDSHQCQSHGVRY